MCNEKIIQKIQKVLELSKNNPSEEEAKAAALKAHKLMAEYHISYVDIENIDDIDSIVEEHVYVKTGNKWKSPLAYTISKNFRCKYFFYGRDTIVFYGHKVDAEIAAETFKFLFSFGNKKATNYYTKIKKSGRNTKGVKNAFLVGYLKGISEALERQSTALMVITPQDVEDSYKAMIEGNGNFKTSKQSGLRVRMGDAGEDAQEEGRKIGRSIVQSRSIERKAV